MVKITIEYINTKDNVEYNVKEIKIIKIPKNFIIYNGLFKYIEEFENKYNIPVFKSSILISDNIYYSDEKFKSLSAEDNYIFYKIKYNLYFKNLEEYNNICKLYNEKFIKYDIKIEDE